MANAQDQDQRPRQGATHRVAARPVGRLALAAACVWIGALCAIAGASPAAVRAPAPRFLEASLRDGEWVDFSPFAFVVRYDAPVRVETAWLVDSLGGVTPLPATGLEGARISVPMPVLVPHHYRLHWRARTRSGAAVTGMVEFAIRGCEEEAGFKPAAQN